MNIYVDCRPFQDSDFAYKGIGQHGMYLLALLKKIRTFTLIPLCDPTLAEPIPEAQALFTNPPQWIADISAGIYLNLSPLTHDTSASTVAKRRGLKNVAVLHDFIAFRTLDAKSNEKNACKYEYRKTILHDYDLLLTNSDFTKEDLNIYLPGYLGVTTTVHCRSRFPLQDNNIAHAKIRELIVEKLEKARPYALWAGADDPRKNLDFAIRSTVDIARAGYRLVIGGGISETTKRRMSESYPDQHVIGDPIYLPRLSDSELEMAYRNASLVIVTSEDEGFSLPVAEAIALGTPVVASRIPAHQEQILDERLLFDAQTTENLMYSVSAVSACVESGRSYRKMDYNSEAADLKARLNQLSKLPTASGSPDSPKTIIVGPGFGNKSGISVYNRLMCAELDHLGFKYDYVDLERFEMRDLYRWIHDNRAARILYVMGNNNVFHTHCFIAIKNVPGDCILHDSRLFEFFLNRYGPYFIADLWNKHGHDPIGVDTVSQWQQDRRMLPGAFLEPMLSRAFRLIVHSTVASEHITTHYNFRNVCYLPFALQMTPDEVALVASGRRQRTLSTQSTKQIYMLGETEPTKCCTQAIFALKLLLLQGLDAGLTFVGKTDEPYFSELIANVNALGLTERVKFSSYVPREGYIQSLIDADVVVQLRYPLFGQVSGPLIDAIACKVPSIATNEMATGTGVRDYCYVIPNDFSPLHIAEAIKDALTADSRNERGVVGTMNEYAQRIIGLLNLQSHDPRQSL